MGLKLVISAMLPVMFSFGVYSMTSDTPSASSRGGGEDIFSE